MVKSDINIKLTFTPTWSYIKDIQTQTEEFITKKGKSKDVLESTIMCATELIENAVKYGSQTPEGANIEFDLNIVGDTVSITVKNGYHHDHDRNNVIEHIEKIKETKDPSELYIKRLQELLDNPKQTGSQLGLYRIAYEGGFSLDYKNESGVITIRAEKKI